MLKKALACILLVAVAGCATQLTSYTPTEGQSVVYEQGVGSVTWETPDAIVTLYPTFRFQSPSDIPTFTLMVQNKSDHTIEFAPDKIQAAIDGAACHVYTLEERVSEIRSAARRKQIALAVLGGVAAGAAAYGASHQTTTYTGYGVVGNRPYWTTGTIQTYDPAAGIFAGAAVGVATGAGIHQIARSAGFEIQAAQGIFQRSTIRPGVTIVGQVMLKKTAKPYDTLRLDIPVDGAGSSFSFNRKVTTG